MRLLSYVHLRNIHRSTGAGRVARQLTEHLSTLPGMEMRILADHGDYTRTISHVGDPWTSYRYHFFEPDTSRQQARWYLLGTPRAEHFWPDVELVHCTMESYVPTRRARLAVTVHDAAIFESGAHSTGSALLKQRLKWKLLYRTLARRADLFHTVSQFSADRLSHFFPAITSRLRVVHNAVCDRFFQPTSLVGDAAVRKLGLSNRPFILLPGGFHYRKNAELVLRAWPLLHRKHPELKLVVINHSDPAYAQAARDLGDSLVTVGFVEDETLCSLYHAAQVVWFPSRYEGFGMPLVEAMACGCPTVASQVSSIPEIAGGASLLMPPDDPQRHVEALDALLTDSRLRSSLCTRGRVRAESFTWRTSAALLHRQFVALI
jgi:glycosyltransferase involved in cell wall biosynthesis